MSGTSSMFVFDPRRCLHRQPRHLTGAPLRRYRSGHDVKVHVLLERVDRIAAVEELRPSMLVRDAPLARPNQEVVTRMPLAACLCSTLARPMAWNNCRMKRSGIGGGSGLS